MTIKEILNMHGIKHAYIQKHLKMTKGGVSHLLNKKMPLERDKEIREILKTLAISLLDVL